MATYDDWARALDAAAEEQEAKMRSATRRRFDDPRVQEMDILNERQREWDRARGKDGPAERSPERCAEQERLDFLAMQFSRIPGMVGDDPRARARWEAHCEAQQRFPWTTGLILVALASLGIWAVIALAIRDLIR